MQGQREQYRPTYLKITFSQVLHRSAGNGLSCHFFQHIFLMLIIQIKDKIKIYEKKKTTNAIR